MNRRNPKNFLAVLLLSILGACASAPEPSEAAQREVRAAVDELLAADRALDAKRVMSLIAPDFYMYQDGERMGYPRVRDMIMTNLPGLKALDANFENVEVTMLGADAALVTMVFRDIVTMADGTTVRNWGPNSTVWRRGPEGWKMIFADADHYDSDAVVGDD